MQRHIANVVDAGRVEAGGPFCNSLKGGCCSIQVTDKSGLQRVAAGEVTEVTEFWI